MMASVRFEVLLQSSGVLMPATTLGLGEHRMAPASVLDVEGCRRCRAWGGCYMGGYQS